MAPSIHRVLQAMRTHAITSLSNGILDPDFGKFRTALERAATPMMTQEYRLGGAVEIQPRSITVPILKAMAMRSMGVILKRAPDVRVKKRFRLPTKDAVAAQVRKLTLDLSGKVTETTKRKCRKLIQAGVLAGEPKTKIAKRLEPIFGKKRALLISATESSRSFHAAKLEAMEDAGAIGSIWKAGANCCKVCEKLDGKKRRFGAPFLSKPGKYGIVFHAPAHPRCECSNLIWRKRK